VHEGKDAISDREVVILHEILKEVEVKLDLDLEVALIEYRDEAGEVGLKSGDQVFVAYDGVQGVSRLQCDNLLVAM
jgi:hypothetical protein